VNYYLRKLDGKTLLAVIVFISMAIMLSDKYSSKHLIAPGEQIKKVVLQSAKGKTTNIYNKKTAKHRIIYTVAPACRLCKFQTSMLKFASSFLDEKKWEIMPMGFDFKTKEHMKAYQKNHIRDFDLYYGNKDIKRILKIETYPSIYFISSTGVVSSRSALPTTLFGILWRAYKTEDPDEDTRPLLHRL
jgi:hypothetical protein